MAKAREQAKKNGYPYFMLITSTPNGVEGIGKFFFDMWNNAVDSDELFVPNYESGLEEWVDEGTVNTAVDNQLKNNFVKIKYHWSEDPTKDFAWYQKQCRDVNHDARKINQIVLLKVC